MTCHKGFSLEGIIKLLFRSFSCPLRVRENIPYLKQYQPINIIRYYQVIHPLDGRILEKIHYLGGKIIF